MSADVIAIDPAHLVAAVSSLGGVVWWLFQRIVSLLEARHLECVKDKQDLLERMAHLEQLIVEMMSQLK